MSFTSRSPYAREVYLLGLLCLAPIAGTFGCVPDGRLNSSARLDRGLVVVLPGIEGPSVWNRDLVLGLDEGGVDCAIRRHVWGTPVPGGFLINLTDIERNRREADRLRDDLVAYMTKYPGRPVQLVGHSGGAGIALLATERLPADCPVTAIVLLAASVSPTYDLRPALGRTTQRILNCYSERDSILLGPGTTIAGTIDREFGESAGKVGFTSRPAFLPVEQRRYAALDQLKWTRSMEKLGNDGGHFGWTNRRFVREWLAPRVRRYLSPDPR
ncbi:MAG: hypothetical protein H6819_00860 [Phycisphaerales bacterium]|nr:hypothetical protein [Phycisphaerales bacterium]MCB9857242.1 hypothetical protein [Phycisphaerales bacterium]MCB9863044.1 hypothetical protein [Phycisphaerales bacterium]